MSVHDITTYINQVKTERYAKDMREALYQALTSLAIDIKTFDAILSDASQETMGRVAEVLQEIYDIKDDLENDIDNIQYAARISALLSEDGLVDTFKGEYVNDGIQHYGMHKYFYISIKKDEEIHFTFTPSQSTAFIIWAYRYDYVDGTRDGNGGVSVYSLSANTPRTLTPTPPDKDVKGLFFYFADCTDYGNGLLELYFDNYYPLSEIISGDSEEDVSKLRNQISSITNILKEYPVGPTGRITQKASGTDVIEIDVSDVMDTDFLANLYLDLSSNNTPTENEALGAVTFYTNNGSHQQGPYIFTSDGFTYPSNTTKHSWMLSGLYKPNGSTNEKVVVEFYSTSNYYGGSGASYRVSLLKSYANKGAGLKTREFTMIHESSNSDSIMKANYYQIGKMVHLSAVIENFASNLDTNLYSAVIFPLGTSTINGIIRPNHDISVLVPTTYDAYTAANKYIYHIRTGHFHGDPVLLIEPAHFYNKDQIDYVPYEAGVPNSGRATVISSGPQYINPDGDFFRKSAGETTFRFDLTYTTDDINI